MEEHTPILMFDGTIKSVQDINVNDLLMGDDSTPRTVLSLSNNNDKMYKITNIKGDTYTVNEKYILCFNTSNYGIGYDKRTKKYIARYLNKENLKIKSKSFETKEKGQHFLNLFINENKLVETSVQIYTKLNKTIKHILKGYKVGIDFEEKKLPLDPYILGLWLGDGTSRKAEFTNQEAVILKYLSKELLKYDCYLSYTNRDYHYRFCSLRKKYSKEYGRNNNLIKNILTELNLIKNKHIPDIYKYNSRENRLKLLAGLLDTDGYHNKNCYDLIQKNNKLSKDIVYLTRSLGFACYSKKCKKTCTNAPGGPKTGEYNRMSISGEKLYEIPVLCPRKKAGVRKQIKNPLVSGITVTSTEKQEKCYSFTLDGNHKFILGNFIVAHDYQLSPAPSITYTTV